MSVNVRIQLPDKARINNVAKVIGIAAGLPAVYHKFDDIKNGYVEVDGIEVSPSSVPQCAEITWREGVDLGDSRYVLYHFEWSDGGRGLLPPSTPFWCAVGLKLVSLFGGSIQFRDCSSDVDFRFPVNPLCGATDGDEWEAWQQEMLAVGPITEGDLRYARTFAAYKGGRE